MHLPSERRRQCWFRSRELAASDETDGLNAREKLTSLPSFPQGLPRTEWG